MILKITEFLDNDSKNRGLIINWLRYKIIYNIQFKVKQLKQITEEYFNRSDKIKRRVVDFTTGWEVETFDRGRSKFVKGKRKN